MLSYPENVGDIMAIGWAVAPKKVLDVGCAFGKYGLMFREQYLSGKAMGGELEPVDDFKIDCFELTDYFLTGKNGKRVEAIYDEIHKGDIFTAPEDFLAQYDLLLMIDIIEHYPKQVILEFLQRCPVPVLISTPRNPVMYEEHFYGDPHVHQTKWELVDLETLQLHGKTLEHYKSDNPRSIVMVVAPTSSNK